MECAVKTVAFTLYEPQRRESAVVFSSPHSGCAYSAAFLEASILDAQTVRSSEDAFVDQLFLPAILHGAPLIAANAPRAFIDLNRAMDELDPAVIEGVPRSPHNPRVASGLGVIPRVVAAGRAIYRGKLTRTEAESRILAHWQPYHAALQLLMQQTHQNFGQAVLIDCHSMPHEAVDSPSRLRSNRPDVVLGDRFGVSASAEVVEMIERAFVKAGLRVARNAPFAGAYITQTYGRPSRGMHAVQVEIDRALYMNEARIEKSADYEAFQQLLVGIIADLARIGRSDQALAAE